MKRVRRAEGPGYPVTFGGVRPAAATATVDGDRDDTTERVRMTAAATFTSIFREEHREVRDLLFDLIDAFRARDLPRARSLLVQIANLTGPHFRYEEESLYPDLVDVFGAEYVEKLLADHDGAVRTARRLVELAGKDTLQDAEVDEAVAGARSILPHVSDCDGLSIMVERFPPERIAHILQTRTDALAADVDLLTWARTIRQRAV